MSQPRVRRIARGQLQVSAEIPVQTEESANGDAQLVAMWLHGRSRNTIRAYRRDAERLLSWVGRPLRLLTLRDVQAFADTLSELAPASQVRTLAAIKSLLAFGQRTGYLRLNVGAALRLPRVRNTLAERLLPEATMRRMLALEPDLRNRVMLRLCYAAGLRVSELVGLKWRDVQPRGGGHDQITVHGKGGKTRAILLPASVTQELASYAGLMSTAPGATALDQAVFRSRTGAHLSPRQLHRVVRAAAARAGITARVSPHWLRHAHATHALERGAPIHLVKDTLGHASIATTDKYLHARPDESSATYLAV